mmetsp:Transcript_26338/g.77306  ORF Transcript_26338/g.77306 Transcript_26338/m.77306 type:complete len:297 (+) Transcript_26338:6445-7335(+)
MDPRAVHLQPAHVRPQEHPRARLARVVPVDQGDRPRRLAGHARDQHARVVRPALGLLRLPRPALHRELHAPLPPQRREAAAAPVRRGRVHPPRRARRARRAGTGPGTLPGARRAGFRADGTFPRRGGWVAAPVARRGSHPRVAHARLALRRAVDPRAPRHLRRRPHGSHRAAQPEPGGGGGRGQVLLPALRRVPVHLAATRARGVTDGLGQVEVVAASRPRRGAPPRSRLLPHRGHARHGAGAGAHAGHLVHPRRAHRPHGPPPPRAPVQGARRARQGPDHATTEAAAVLLRVRGR